MAILSCVLDGSTWHHMSRLLQRARDFYFWSAFTGAFPLALLAWFTLRVRRGLAAPPSEYAPAATVIVPWKRTLARAEATVRAMLQQEYRGTVEYLFVVPSRDAAARPELERILGLVGDSRVRMLVSNAVPADCGEKILNQLHAVAHGSRESRVFVFADQDVCVDCGWLGSLIKPLGDPRVGASTTGFLECGGARPFTRAIQFMSLAGFYPFAALRPALFGPSFAMRRDDFERLGIAALWRRRVTDEIPLAPFLRERGLRVAFAPEAIIASQDPAGLRDYLDAFSRWLFFVHRYDLKLWLLFYVALALKTEILGEMVTRRAWGVLASVLACDAAYGALVCALCERAYLRRLRDRFPELAVSCAAAALAWPLLLVFYWIAFIRSMFGRKIRWSGYSYEHLGPDQVVATRIEGP